jgi:uncharacterized protein
MRSFDTIRKSISSRDFEGEELLLSLLTRRKFLIAAGTATLGAAVLADETIIRQPNHPQLVRIDMPLPRLAPSFDGFRIALLSDFHYDEIFSIHPIRRAVEIVNQINPDLAVLTGDFVTVSILVDYVHDEAKSARTAEPCARLLSQLRSRLGSLATLGNHDIDAGAELVTEALQSHGIPVLRNASRSIEQSGKRLWICGLDSTHSKPDIELGLRGVPEDEPVIVLMHEPDFADVIKDYPVDLQLSGHSHGGQVWIPGLGAPWLPTGARKYPRGRYTVGRLPLYTNIGLGTIRTPVRFNCPPEVTLITLRSPEANRSAT